MFTLTEKKHVTDVTRIETEREITEAEYLRALGNALSDHRTVEKIRYRIPAGRLLWEIDLFPFWQYQAYLEVELESEDDTFVFPGFVEVIREVTDDQRYTNKSLAREIPMEDL